MKLRLKGNSLRLRLTRSEVSRIGDGVAVSETVRFGPHPAHCLEYRLAPAKVDSVSATFFDRKIEVSLPLDVARSWAASPEITLSREQEVSMTEKLQILVEKDFACLTPRPGEDDSDAFPNPNSSC
jgi:hypothetical protein